LGASRAKEELPHMETIQKIEDTTFRVKRQNGEDEYEGFVVTTDKQVIKIGVDNYGQCCENWGHFASADNLDNFIGAKLSTIAIADGELESGLIAKRVEGGIYEGGIMHVNLDTDRGILQFTAYNAHNGYYGHEGIVLSEQLNHTCTL